MLRPHVSSMRHLEEWFATERRMKAQVEAEARDLEKAAKAQVDRPRQRWCIGSGESEGGSTSLESVENPRARFRVDTITVFTA